MPTDPWTFGWTQVFTILGFVVTIGIAIGGFRTFGRWKREKLEERRIETALEALSVTYESKYVFDQIRSPLTFGNEWKDMPRTPGESDKDFNRRGPYYAVGQRVTANKDFFDRLYKLQPRCMALFGAQCEETFFLLHKARRTIEVSSQALAWNDNSAGDHSDQNKAFYDQCRRDIWDHGSFEPEKDEVGKKVTEFRTKMEAMCRPVVDHELKIAPALGSAAKLLDAVLGII